MSPRRLFILVLVALAGALALHAWRYWPFLSDDALISLRYAKRFANGEGLTWNDGERVEGYTNFLWVVLTAVTGKLGLGFVLAARVLGFASVVLAVACVGLDPRSRSVSLPRLVAGGILIVSTAPFAIWSIGGLEQGLLAGLVALSFRVLERAAWAPDTRPAWHAGIPLAALALTRADGVLLVFALLAGAACLPRPSLASLKRACLTAIPCAVAVLAQLVFRLAYYGDFLPNTARVKLAFTSERLGAGFAYMTSGYASSSMLVLLALVATVLAVRRGDGWRLVMPWAVIVSWTAYVVVVGGDIFPGFRQLVPALVGLCFVVADEVAANWPRLRGQRLLVVPVLVLCVVLHATQGTETADNRRAKDELWEWDGLSIGRTLKTAFGAKQPLLAVDSAGALPFWSEFPSLDMLGLNDRHIASLLPKNFGTGYVGHELGDGAYVLHRAPDLVVFQTAAGDSKPLYRSGLKLLRSKEFQQKYQWIRLRGAEGNEAVGEIWVRRERGKLGVVRAADRIEVPGYFFTGQASNAETRLHATGVLMAELTTRAPGVVPELSVPAGRWKIDVSPPDPAVIIDMRCPDASMQRTGPDARVFEADGRTPISIALAPGAGVRAMKLRTVTLSRTTDEAATLRCSPAEARLRLSTASLGGEKPKRTSGAHPSNRLFTKAGIAIDLGVRQTTSHVELSLSQNDGYLLELRRDGEIVWVTNVERKRRKTPNALVTHAFDLPKAIEAGNLELSITPRQGDTACSLGHLELR